MTARTFWQFLLSSARRGAPLGEVREAVLGTAAFAASVPGLASARAIRRRAAFIAREYAKARAVVRAAPFRRYRDQLERLGAVRFLGARGPAATLAWRAHLTSASLVGDFRRGEYAVSAATLARRALLSPRAMTEWTRVFIRAGWLTRVRVGRRGAGVSVYRIEIYRPALGALLADRTDLSDKIAAIKGTTLKALLLEEIRYRKRIVSDSLPDAVAEGRGAEGAETGVGKDSLISAKLSADVSAPRRRRSSARSPAYRRRPLGRASEKLHLVSRDDSEERSLIPAFGHPVPLAVPHPVWRRFRGPLPYLLWTSLSETDAWSIARHAASDQRRLRRALRALRDAGLAKQVPAGGWLRIEHADLDDLDRTLGHLDAACPPREAK